MLLDEGPAQTLDGNFALMDIAAAQLAADRLGLLDYVDVLLRPEFDADQILPTLQEPCPRPDRGATGCRHPGEPTP